MQADGKDKAYGQAPERKRVLGVSPTVFVLGIVSFLTDISSEMLVPVVPQFLKFIVRTSGAYIGLIEGIAESTASILRVWAGYIADRSGRPKLLTVIGYGLSAFTKPFYVATNVFSGNWYHVLAIRFGDRFGKGIRSAPRDVLIADATDDSVRGRAFGFHRAMDTAGATLGPLIILLLVWLLAGRLPAQMGHDRRIYTIVFVAASVPAVLGWLVLLIFVRERKRDLEAKKPDIRLSYLDNRFRFFLVIVTLFSIGNSSDAFLVLRATSEPIGMGFIQFLWVYVLFNAVGALTSFRGGILSDKIGRKPVIIAGWVIFAVVYLGMAAARSVASVWIWFLIYGLYYGMTEGILRAYAVDLAPRQLRGTAIGAYYTFTGVALLPASIIAGQLWDKISPSAPFYYGAATAIMAAVLLVLLPARREPTTDK